MTLLARALLLPILLVASAASSAQTDRFVTTPGELSAAIAASRPGDSVTMANGTWTNLLINFDRDGAPGDSIRLQAETPGQVILNGTSTLAIGGDYLVVDGLRFEGGSLQGGRAVVEFRRSSSQEANHSRLTNCTIIDYNPLSDVTEYKWVSLYGRFNRVDHCYFAGKTNEGALMVVWLDNETATAPPTHRIDRNHFGPRPELGRNGAEIIRIGTSDYSMQDSDMLVEENLFTETNGEIEAISNKSGNNTYRANTFRRMDATLTLRHGNGCLVEGNFFIGEGLSGTGGVRIIGEDHRVINNYFQDLRGTGYSAAVSLVQGVVDSPLNRYFQVKRPVIAHNTFVNVEEPFLIGVKSSSDQSLAPEDVTIVNNAIQTRLSADIYEEDKAPVGTTTYANNVAYGDPSSFPSTGFTFADPELELDADGVYRPSASSPVVGAADPTYAPALDMDGQPRDASPDAGADEISSAPVTRRPLTDRDVGPDWRIGVSTEGGPEVGMSRLQAPAPNPFRDRTELTFTLERPAHVRLQILDVTGRQVALLMDRMVLAGEHHASLDASDLASGTYLAVLAADGALDSRPLTLLRR